MLKELQFKSMSDPMGLGRVAFSKQKDIQDKVQAIIREDIKKNPDAGSAIVEKAKGSTSFKGPEGFSNVVGVGANPVLEAMTRQTELLDEIKVILQDSKPSNNGVPTPFTERMNAASRTGVA
jgi:hypothetical protein